MHTAQFLHSNVRAIVLTSIQPFWCILCMKRCHSEHHFFPFSQILSDDIRNFSLWIYQWMQSNQVMACAFGFAWTFTNSAMNTNLQNINSTMSHWYHSHFLFKNKIMVMMMIRSLLQIIWTDELLNTLNYTKYYFLSNVSGLLLCKCFI